MCHRGHYKALSRYWLVGRCESWRKFLSVGRWPRLHAWRSQRQSRSQWRFHHYQINERCEQVLLFFIIFKTLFLCIITGLLYHGDQKISLWRIYRWRVVNFEFHLCSSGVNSDLGECFFLGGGGVCASRWSHQLTSEPKRWLLFWKCLQWSCLKAVSLPKFVIGGQWGSPATSGFCSRANSRIYFSNPLDFASS